MQTTTTCVQFTVKKRQQILLVSTGEFNVDNSIDFIILTLLQNSFQRSVRRYEKNYCYVLFQLSYA